MRAVTQPCARALGPVTTVANAAARIATVKRNRIKLERCLWFERRVSSGSALFVTASPRKPATFGADCGVGAVNGSESVAGGRIRIRPRDGTQKGEPQKGAEGTIVQRPARKPPQASLHFSPTLVAADVRRRMDRASAFSASSRRRLPTV